MLQNRKVNLHLLNENAQGPHVFSIYEVMIVLLKVVAIEFLLFARCCAK